MKENLAPSCHAIHPGEKIHSSINFEAKLVAFALPNKKESAIRLAKALEHAKSLLLCEKKNNTHSIASSVEDITRYTQKIVDYLSLVKGFLNCKSIISAKSMKNIPPNASGAPSSGGAAAIADLLKTTPPVSVSALNEPLIDPAGMSSPNVAVADISQQDLSCCLNFCDWTDLLSNRTIFALNAKHEYAQTLLATGVQMLVQANTIVDILMSDRLSEMDEKKLKIAYQLFLHAAGVFDACVIALGVTPRNIGTKPGEVSNAEGLGIPNEEAMAKWRAEQQKKISDSVISHNNNNNIEDEEDTSCRNRTCGGSEEVFSTNRIPDLFEANLPQVFGWISLAQAQELVILRGISREFIDFSLMAKLSIDISYRYQECQHFIAHKLPCESSFVAEKLRVYCFFKDVYYAAISVYYQGAVCLLKEEGPSCALAIANFKKAKELIEEATKRKKIYDTKKNKQDSTFDQIFLRSQQIIQRDLDIAIQRNDSVYYERIPDHEVPIDPLGLVRQVSFPSVKVHELWNDPEISSCLNPSVVSAPLPFPTGNEASAATTATSGASGASTIAPSIDPTHKSCCRSCVIS